ANPQSVASAGISTITAQVTTSAGTPAPDGTAVNFSVTQGTGGVDAFAQTTSGVATAQFTAPTLPSGFGGETDRITATSGGVSGSTAVTVTAAPQPTATPVPTPTPPPLTVTPATVPISCTTGGIATFVVTGGSPGYTITSSLASVVVSPTTVTASGKTFSATVAADCTGIPAAGRPVSIAVVDTKSNLFTATVTITNP
ncbi:MAG TPA: hypothetical protein VEI96_03650, partial [Thermodesulfovibrionales bacterium]|nr:hypothetical protein [Thermodesulfovibrionales bacterium]